MAVNFVTPYIPQSITVHLGAPSSAAENVTLSFPDYIKNVASSEIYPTWEPTALRANILAIISFALNRVYTEFYPSRGYPFHITASTAYDQKFIRGRNVFDTVDRIVDESFNTYIRRVGFVEPLSAKFCNGTTSTCAGLSQWGSQALAKQGLNSVQILRHYYGENIELVVNAPVKGVHTSYPGYPLQPGSQGSEVAQMQVMLNRISQNYPAIPKISPEDGIFGANTKLAVVKFQQIFSLTPDGIVGNGTWYKMIFLYVGILNLAELNSQGLTLYNRQIAAAPPPAMREGDTGEEIKVVQYMLSVIAEFYDNIPTVTIDGNFGTATRRSVQAVQAMAGLRQDGAVGQATWEALYRIYAGITETMAAYANVIPPAKRPKLDRTAPVWLTQYPGRPLTVGDADTRGGTI